MKTNRYVTVAALLFSILILSQNQAEAEKLPINTYPLTKFETKKIIKPKTINQLMKSNYNISKSVGTSFTYGIYKYEVLSENPNTVMVTGFASETDITSTVDIPEVVQNSTETYTVVKIGESAFYNLGIVNLNLPSITEIGIYAFASNPITKLTAPKLEVIEDSGLAYTELKSIDLPKIRELGDFALNGHQMESIELPSLVKLGEGALAGGNVKSIDLVNLTKVETKAFYTMESLESVNLPNVEEVEFWGFMGTGLTEISLPKVHTIGVQAFSYSGCKIEKVDLPNVKVIGDMAFYKHKMTDLYLPEAVGIGGRAFEIVDHEGEDIGLETINLPKTEVINYNAFSGNRLKELNTTDIPSLKTIENDVFSNNQIEKISLDNIIEIENSAFLGNKLTKLTNANIPNVSVIRNSSFSDNQIKILDLPNISEIESSGFNNNKLEEIRLPDVSAIKSSAFGENKSKFLELFVSDKLVSVEENIFGGANVEGDIDIFNSGNRNIEQLEKVFLANIVTSWQMDTKFNTTNLWSSDGYTYLISDNVVKATSGDTFTQEVEQTMKKGKTIFKAGEDWQNSLTNDLNKISLLDSDEIQWYKDNLALQGQNKPQLNFSSLEKTDSGDYYAVVNGQKLSNFALEVDASSQTEESIDSNATIDVEKIEDNGQVIFSSNASDKASIIFESVDQRNLKNEYPETTQASIELKDTRTKANKYQVDASIEKNTQNLYDFSKNDMEITINPETKETDITVSKMITLTDQAQSIFTTEYDSSLSKEEKSVTLNALLKSSNFDKLEPGKQYNTKIVWELTIKP